MNKITKSNYYFYSSLLCAVWFLLTSYFWSYYANLFISFPFGLVSLLLWYKGKQIDVRKKRYNITIIILMVGLVISLAALILLLANN